MPCPRLREESITMSEVIEEQMQDTIDLISRALQDTMSDIRFMDQNKAKNPISMAKMRLLTELVMLAMEDIDIQTKCLQKEQGKHISVHLRALHDAMNKARYFLNQLEASDGSLFPELHAERYWNIFPPAGG
jgi:hypothetical protein